jgi:hypothetical protein
MFTGVRSTSIATFCYAETGETEIMNLNDMSKCEKSLLLYLETRAVDHGGLVCTQHMNSEDMATAKRWSESGFVRFGRLAADCLPGRHGGSTHWCELSDDAWTLAHSERRERYTRINSKRKWLTTDEKRAA